MFGRKKGEIKEGDFIFTSRKDEGDYHNLIFGTVTGVDGNKIGVNGFFVNPIGLKIKSLKEKQVHVQQKFSQILLLKTVFLH